MPARRVALILFCLCVFAASVFQGMRRNNHWDYFLMLSWDSLGYYLYLPAVAVNHSFENLDTRPDNGNPDTYTFRPYPGTKRVFTKYTYGVALMESPFFLISRWLHKLRYHDEPGFYSPGYMKSIIVSGAFYLAAGLFILGLLLLRYFSLPVVILSELIIWLGTNLLYYSSFAIGFSHVYSFFLITCILCLTPLMYESRSVVYVFLLAVLLGIVTVIRPTNAVVAFYIFFYDVHSWAQLRVRVIYLIKMWPQLLLFPVCGFLAWTPQFAYWHYVSGHWLLYSYEQEGFIYWKNPKMLSVLFHPQNGFFLFAPLMLLSMAGLYMILRRKQHSAPVILLIFLLTDYICGSWWYWNFGAAYGFRPYIDLLPLLVLPLAYFLSVASHWRLPVRAVGLTIIVFLLLLSLRLQQIYSYPWQGPDWGWKDILRIHKEALFIK